MAYIVLVSLGFIPSLAWLFFFLMEDVHPEPKKMIFKAFVAGAIITFVAIFFQMYFQKAIVFLSLQDAHPLPFFLFALIEEILKFFAAWLMVRKSRFFDEPIDAMVYMIAASLGFALVENVAIAVNIGELSGAASAITIRSVGATLLHALSSAVVGYYWAKGMINPGTMKIMIFKGLAMAAIIHTLFNYIVAVSGDAVMAYPTVFLAIIALFIFWDFDKVKIFIQKSE
jgi:RsiW-degrading membrane proteinase PrsW (M82 family)